MLSFSKKARGGAASPTSGSNVVHTKSSTAACSRQWEQIMHRFTTGMMSCYRPLQSQIPVATKFRFSIKK